MALHGPHAGGGYICVVCVMVTYSDIGDMIVTDMALYVAGELDPVADPVKNVRDPDLMGFIQKVGQRIYRPWIKDRLEFAFDDPPSFASENRATDAIFIKLMDYLRSTTGIDDNGLIALVNKFSGACSKDVWTNLYQPILQRVPFPNITTAEFNWWMKEVALGKPIRPLATGSRVGEGFPDRAGHLYPIPPNSDLISIVVWKDSVDVFSIDYKTHLWWDEIALDAEVFKRLLNRPELEYPLLIDAAMSSIHDDSVELIDVVPMGQQKVWPGKFRRHILEDLYNTFLSGYSEFSLCDGYHLNDPSDIDAAISHFNDASPTVPITQGLFVADDLAYANSTILVPLLRG
jgi:hypothetical protein